LSVQSADDIALIPDSVFANFLTGTVSLWVKTTDSANSGYYWADPELFGSDLSGFTDSAFGIQVSGGNVGIWGELHIPGQDLVATSTATINDNQWHFIVAKINDGGQCKLYVDNVFVDSIPAGYPLPQRIYAIMGKGPTRATVTTGFVDDVRINDQILTDSEITNLYESNTVAIPTLKNNGSYFLQNDPNPFSNTTTIRYSLPASIRNASIIITDLTGRTVRILAVTSTEYGKVNFGSQDIENGVYLYSLVTSEGTLITKRMVVSK
jgi:hypothetical protein